jgi:hypothetical protein
VPPGANVPLVMQVGKWRRQVAIPSVPACTRTTVADVDLTRLPRNQAEGHLPRIAVVTGHADAFECLLRNLGIADDEFTNDEGSGRVNLFLGGAGDAQSEGATQLVSGELFADAYTTLFASPAKLASYDYLLLDCEGAQLESPKEPYFANMKGYADGGGRIFVEHLQFPWISKGPSPWPATASWVGVGPDLPSPTTVDVNTSFARGAALADWLLDVGASSTRGQISLVMAQNSVDAVAPGTLAWVTTGTRVPTQSPVSTQALSFATPVEAASTDAQCGRVDFTDIHVAADAGVSHPETPFPMGCLTPDPSSAQSKLWEFLFFDARSCAPAAP